MIDHSDEGTVVLLTEGPFQAGDHRVLRFVYKPSGEMPPGSRLWMFFEFRQGPGKPQHLDCEAVNYVSATTQSGRPAICETYETRSLDLYPRVPEFFYGCEFGFDSGLPNGDEIHIKLGGEHAGWQLPSNPIDAFHFWLLESESPAMRFMPTGYRTYREFNVENPERLQANLSPVTIGVEGELPRPDPRDLRDTPGILWGDIHGMAFNQRPLDDYYRYAREVAHLDFAALMLFSYNVCVGGLWQAVKDAADRWAEPGRFLTIVGVESGTVPDGSHRNAYYFDPSDVPPIFCEDRPPARQARFTRRTDPDTIFCNTLDEYYDMVRRYGGLVTGHFHTLEYHQEIAAEIWQKQLGSKDEEIRIFDLLNRGMRLGIVAGSDTHDSMPGNPAPEMHCPQPAGLMAVHGVTATAQTVRDAFLTRRVYGTTGARIGLRFCSGQAPMGSILPGDKPRDFQIQVEGTTRVEEIDLICCGQLVRQLRPQAMSIQAEMTGLDSEPTHEQWYVLRVIQEDGHRAWSSPIWFTGH